MGWWKRFKVWLMEEPAQARSPLQDWKVYEEIFAPKEPSTAPRWSDARPGGPHVAETATSPKSIVGLSDPASDVSNGLGEEKRTWFPVETIEGVPPVEDLDHAESLPSSTFRVFPDSWNHRNSYDSASSVKRAVAYRTTRSGGYYYEGRWVPRPTKVYRAETVWRDVTDEHVKPDGQG